MDNSFPLNLPFAIGALTGVGALTGALAAGGGFEFPTAAYKNSQPYSIANILIRIQVVSPSQTPSLLVVEH